MYEEIFCDQSVRFVECIDQIQQCFYSNIIFTGLHPKVIFHTQFRLIFVLEGYPRLLTGKDRRKKEYAVCPGTLLIAPPNSSTHWVEFDPRKSVFFSLVFWPAYLRSLLFEAGPRALDSRSYCNHTSYTGKAHLHLLDAMNEYSNEPEKHLEKLNLMVKVLLQICHDSLLQTNQIAASKSFSTYKQIQQLMFTEIDHKITRDTVAHKIGITAAHISKLFHRFENSTFSETLFRIRMERAATLLTSSNFTLKEIAFRCGYPDLGYFIHSFKKFYGYTPGKYQIRLLSSQ